MEGTALRRKVAGNSASGVKRDLGNGNWQDPGNGFRG
jgi:hypothetical protein